MANVLVNDSSLSAIGAAIRAKNGSSDTYKPGDMAAAIAAIPTGGGASDVPERDVNYYDWDGTLLHSYTAAEFAQMTEHPANPTHTGLTSQGWNWTLAGAKTYVAKTGFLDIGQFVVSADGKTHVKVFANGDAGHDTITFNKSGTPDIVVDWGDGTTETITASSASHAYAAAGEYEAVITHGNNNGSKSFPYLFGGAAIRQIIWGDCEPSVGLQPWSGLADMQYVALPRDATFSLSSCSAPSLRHITLRGSSFALNRWPGMATMCIGNLAGPPTIEGTSSLFISLRHVAMPETGQLGSSSASGIFRDNKVLTRAALTSSMKYLCYQCTALRDVTLFYNFYVSVAENSFYGCENLPRIVIPEGITHIGNYAFQGCYALKYISLPSTLTNIGNQSFVVGTYAMSAKNVEFHFKATTPPTVANSNAFNYIDGATCKIYVPTGSLSAYTSATNYPNPNTFTYVEED